MNTLGNTQRDQCALVSSQSDRDSEGKVGTMITH